MQNQNNFWKISTIFLSGIMLGFFGAKILPSNMPTSEAAQAAKTQTLAEAPSAEASSPAPVPVEQEPINYQELEVSQNSEGNWTMGSKNAKVVVEDFTDYECPACYAYAMETYGPLIENYIKTGKVHYVLYNYPLSMHPHAPKAAEAALCAGDQNQYWPMHDLLFENQNLWRSGNEAQIFKNLAKSLGLKADEFENCLDTGKYQNQIQKDLALGRSKGVSGTPTFFINDQKVVGSQSFEYMQSLLEGML